MSHMLRNTNLFLNDSSEVMLYLMGRGKGRDCTGVEKLHLLFHKCLDDPALCNTEKGAI